MKIPCLQATHHKISHKFVLYWPLDRLANVIENRFEKDSIIKRTNAQRETVVQKAAEKYIFEICISKL